MTPAVRRTTLAEYQAFVHGLCGGPPGEEQDGCARQIVIQLCSMYRERGLMPPSGLNALAKQLQVENKVESE